MPRIERFWGRDATEGRKTSTTKDDRRADQMGETGRVHAVDQSKATVGEVLLFVLCLGG